MYFVARYPGLTEGCAMRWGYFGSGHGKGKVLTLSSCELFFLLKFHNWSH
jgi:hypothetical protein